MYSVFFSIISTVVLLNLYLLLVPDGKYEKYVGFLFGLLVMLITAQTIFKQDVKLSFEPLDFDAETAFSDSAVSRLALEQWIEGIAEGNLSSSVQIKVKKQGEDIRCVEVYPETELEEKEILWLAEQCDINREKFVVK